MLLPLLFLGFLGGAFPLLSGSRFEQTSAPTPLPTELKPTDVEIQLTFVAHGGCVQRCMKYRVTLRGDGFVQYDDLGGEPRNASQSRVIPMDEALAVVTELLQAGIVEAPTAPESRPDLMRHGESLKLVFRGGGEEEWNINLRLGAWTKLLKLEKESPLPFMRVRAELVRLGGPTAWTTR